ncbi:MAG TPA: chemotaxis protein CheA [Xanthomonadales bacterium]|nr:chemotaxis protein CheA [Xanthomonadales bacterium]
MIDLDDGVAADFLIEAGEIAERLGEELVALEQAPSDGELLNSVFRGFHTIKGGAGFLELTPMVEACHAVEEAFGLVRSGKRSADAVLFDGAQALLDQVQRMLAALSSGRQPQSAPPEVLQPVLAWAGLLPMAEHPTVTHPAGDDLLAAFASADGPISDDEFEALLDRLNGAEPAAASPPPAVTVSPPAAARAASGSARVPSSDSGQLPDANRERSTRAEPAAEPTLRIEAKRLDAMVNLVGELVLARNRFKALRKQIDGDEFDRAVTTLDVATTRLQNAVMKTRMQPIGRVFQRFPKLARDVARTLEKEVDLVLEGADTELDRTLVEALSDPLVHLVRNAIDHGIEMPDVRERLGKSRVGQVLLAARQEGDHIAIEVREDGAGMDPEALRRKAIEKGLLEPEAAARLSNDECLHLIFQPGFSTKAVVTEISGRGVGMDVVQSRIRELNGRIQIRSRPGEGTAFIVQVPLTLAILPALLIGAGGRTFALPLARVREVLHFDPRQLRWVDGAPILYRHEKALPLFSLREWLADAPAERPEHVVVMQSGPGQIGLRVDDVHGREEIVIKPLPTAMQSLKGYVGAALTGDGSMALILDIDALRHGAD